MRVRTVLLLFAAAALAASASAATKVTGTAHCTPDTPSPVEVGDVPGHAVAIGKAQCTWTGFEIGGVAYKDGVSVSMDEIMGDKSTANGYHTATLANGDKTTAHFHGTATLKDGKPQSVSGTWMFSNGTGKCKGIKGKGTYKGAPNPDGTMTFNVEGEYSIR